MLRVGRVGGSFHPARPTFSRSRYKRINCNEARPYPPDGYGGVWWERLKKAFGTASSAFVEASLCQLIAAARLPGGGISEIAVNAALTFIEGAKPRDEVESALAIQMASTHTAAMNVLARLRSAGGGDRLVAARTSAASHLLRTFTIQAETRRRIQGDFVEISRGTKIQPER